MIVTQSLCTSRLREWNILAVTQITSDETTVCSRSFAYFLSRLLFSAAVPGGKAALWGDGSGIVGCLWRMIEKKFITLTSSTTPISTCPQFPHFCLRRSKVIVTAPHAIPSRGTWNSDFSLSLLNKLHSKPSLHYSTCQSRIFYLQHEVLDFHNHNFVCLTETRLPYLRSRTVSVTVSPAKSLLLSI
jgi:hypothetical protein